MPVAEELRDVVRVTPCENALPSRSDAAAWAASVARNWARLRLDDVADAKPAALQKRHDCSAVPIILVRHPMERLLAAFTDGCVVHPPGSYNHRLLCQNFPSSTPSFSRFIGALTRKFVHSSNQHFGLQSAVLGSLMCGPGQQQQHYVTSSDGTSLDSALYCAGVAKACRSHESIASLPRNASAVNHILRQHY